MDTCFSSGLRFSMIAFLLAMGCGSSEEQRPEPSDAGQEADGAGEDTFGQSACFQCETAACSTELARCNADPGCGAWLTCVAACPVAPGGDVEPSCAAACPIAPTSEGVAGQEALHACWTSGAGAFCAPCGRMIPDSGPSEDAGDDAGEVNPILAQQCEEATNADPCIECRLEQCCDSNAAVRYIGSPARNVWLCWNNCTDALCEWSCYEDTPEGLPVFGEYLACRSVRCTENGECGTRGACSTCLYTECANEFAYCYADPSCFLATNCIGNCNMDPDCSAACTRDYAPNSAVMEAYFACIATRCSDACSG